MKRWFFIVVFVLYPAPARTQSITVGYRQTASVPAPGVLAAFSLDDFYAEAKAEDETLTIFGKNPGLAHIVAVVREGTKTLEVRVLPAPPPIPLDLFSHCRLWPPARTAVTNLATPRALPNRKISLTLCAARSIDQYDFIWAACFSLRRSRAEAHSALARFSTRSSRPAAISLYWTSS